MTDKTQTAVDWLVETLKSINALDVPYHMALRDKIKQAKEMEADAEVKLLKDFVEWSNETYPASNYIPDSRIGKYLIEKKK